MRIAAFLFLCFVQFVGRFLKLDGLRNNKGHLVEVQCPDRIRLHGFLQHEESEQKDMLWIVLHGVAGNFYAPTLLASISTTLRELGHATLRVNTRGHDQIAFAAGGWPYLIGSAFEKIIDACDDINAWMGLAHELGFKRIGLVGHSLGAIKSGYYASQVASGRFDGFVPSHLILLSPPRLRHETLRDDPKYGKIYLQDLALATELAGCGEGETLMQIKFPQPLVISAQTYLDKYGTANEYDYLRWADTIPGANWIYGELEVRGTRRNFMDCDKALQEKLGNREGHTINVVSGADHNYTEARAELASVIRGLACGH